MKHLLFPIFVATGLCFGPGLSLSAELVDKVERRLQKKKYDKAQSLCGEAGEGALQDSRLREACAMAELRCLEAGCGPTKTANTLEAVAIGWPGTAAGQEAHEQSAHLTLQAAGTDLAALDVLILTYPGTAAMAEALSRLFQAARRAGPEALLTFARIHPTAAEAAQAHDLGMTLLFTAAEERGSSIGWKRLLTSHSDHPRAAEIRARYLATRFDEAATEASAAGWEALLREHPDHPRQAEAQRAYFDCLFSEAMAEGTVAAWRGLQEHHPAHPRLEEARLNEAEAAYVQARGGAPGQLLTFSQTYPNHPEAEASRHLALQRLVSVQVLAGSRGLATPSSTVLTPQDTRTTGLDYRPGSIVVVIPEVAPSLEADVYLMTGTTRVALNQGVRALRQRHQLPGLRTEARWLTPNVGTLLYRIPFTLCQPEGADAYYGVQLRGAGLELNYPFQVVRKCKKLEALTQSNAVLPIGGRTVRFVQPLQMFQEAFPEYTLARDEPDTGKKLLCREGAQDAVCFLFFDDRLAGLSLRCHRTQCSSAESFYNRLRPLIMVELQPDKKLDQIYGKRAQASFFSNGMVVAREAEKTSQGKVLSRHLMVVDAAFYKLMTLEDDKKTYPGLTFHAPSL